MSHYTTEVRYICEATAGLDNSEGFNSIDTILDNSVDDIFNFDYPIFDETYRKPLNKKILRHFYTREIGEETVGLWKLRLQQTLNEIMPYYNKLYETELMEINPLYNVDLKTTGNSKGNKYENKYESDNVNVKKTGTRTDNFNDTKTKIGTDTDNTKNTVDRTNNGTDTITKTKSQSDKDKETTNSKYTDFHLGAENGKKEINTDKVNTMNEVTNSTDRFSDTPQGSISNLDIENNMYLTNARMVETPHSAVTTDKGNFKTNFEQTHGNDTYSNNGTGSQTKDRIGSMSGTEKQSGTNKNTQKETGTKTGTKTINETTKGNGTNTRTDNLNTNTEGDKSIQGSVNSTEDYLEHVIGYKGARPLAEILMMWRKSFLNIDRMILNDLEVCFFQLW